MNVSQEPFKKTWTPVSGGLPGGRYLLAHRCPWPLLMALSLCLFSLTSSEFYAPTSVSIINLL